MKKYILSGMLGLATGTIISVVTSAIFSDGDYLPINPLSTAGQYYQAHFSPVGVMATAVLIWFAIGLLFRAADSIFEQDWSLLKMTAVHFSVTAIGFTILGILAGWFPLDVSNLLFFWAIFVAIYAFIYWVNYRQMKNSVQLINHSLEN